MQTHPDGETYEVGYSHLHFSMNHSYLAPLPSLRKETEEDEIDMGHFIDLDLKPDRTGL